MSDILGDDISESIAAALQYISYYHPKDYILALRDAYEIEESPAAKDAIAQILTNSRMCAEGHRPICQDTGIVTVFVEWGQECRLVGGRALQQVIDEGVRRAYRDSGNPLRASIVDDPLFSRQNTGDNTPSVVHVDMVPGGGVTVHVAAKGGGSENKSRFAMLDPSDSLVDWVLETVPGMGAGWCPPGMLGIGVGGTAEQAMKLAKRSLMEPIDMAALKARGPADALEALRIELHDKVNALGIGAQGLGGLTTVLDVKIATWPTHAASKPVALIPNCAATRHVQFHLDGSGPAFLEPPSLDDWPEICWAPAAGAKRVDLDSLTKAEIVTWKPGDRLLLSGKMLTARDAAHNRLQDMLARGEEPPVSLAGRVVYYVGPVDPVPGETVGPAGPTTASRMDKYSEMIFGRLGVLATVGKADRGQTAIDSIRRHGAAYLIAVGGAAYLVSRAVRKARKVAFEDLGMEAIFEFEVRDMPVTVAISPDGESLHRLAPASWRRSAGSGLSR